jgi:molybdopterin/thiamine biosynthesis adenylyltransferase
MNTLTCPFPIFQRLLRLLAEVPQRVVFAHVGISQKTDRHQWLVYNISLELPETGALKPPSTRARIFRITRGSNPSSLYPLSPAVIGGLHLGEGDWHGHLHGIVRIGDKLEPLHKLFLVGKGMHSLPIRSPFHGDGESPDEEFELSPKHISQCSRTIGALGGKSVFKRLISLKTAVIGCGRSGSLVAGTLGRLGIHQLTLIDPDVVEAHNLGEMELVQKADIGFPKAESIASRLEPMLIDSSPVGSPPVALSGGTTIVPIVAPISDRGAIAQAIDCDVLYCCADNDAARLATALLSTLYHKIHIDIGTGIHSPIGARRMGADVRVILPGDGCLLCRGNLTNYNQAIEDLCSHRSSVPHTREWEAHRAGSLRSLNQIAVGTGIQMLQELVAERIHLSTWAQIEVDMEGKLQINYPDMPDSSEGCALCGKMGLGDDGL